MSKGVNISQMTAILDRIDRLEEDKKAIAEDIKEVWAEAKANGYTKELRKAHAIRKMKIEDRRILGTYVEAMDLFG